MFSFLFNLDVPKLQREPVLASIASTDLASVPELHMSHYENSCILYHGFYVWNTWKTGVRGMHANTTWPRLARACLRELAFLAFGRNVALGPPQTRDITIGVSSFFCDVARTDGWMHR